MFMPIPFSARRGKMRGIMKANKFILHKYLFLSAIIILFSTSAISQIKIHERIEIKPLNAVKPTANTVPPNITLPALNMSDFALYGAGFIESFDDIYDDRIFVPRIGGTMGIALDQYCGSATNDEILLVFGPSGNIRNQYNLKDLDTCCSPPLCIWDPVLGVICLESSEDQICWLNPWEYSPELYEETHDTLKSFYPPYRMFFPVNAWEPLRFRLCIHDGIIVKPNFDSGIGWWDGHAYLDTYYPGTFANDIAISVITPQYSCSGALICRPCEIDTVA
jgi:hypothetical protein